MIIYQLAATGRDFLDNYRQIMSKKAFLDRARAEAYIPEFTELVLSGNGLSRIETELKVVIVELELEKR